MEFAYKAIELAPNSSRGYHALGLAHWFMQDVDASVKALESAIALNPNATEIMANIGLHRALLADFGIVGFRFLEEALARSPALPGTNRIGLCLYHFANGRFGEALPEAAQIRAPRVAHGFVAQAISLVRLGRKDEAAAAVRRILDVAPCSTSSGMLADLAGAKVNRDLANQVAAALEDAGLPGDSRAREFVVGFSRVAPHTHIKARRGLRVEFQFLFTSGEAAAGRRREINIGQLDCSLGLEGAL